MKNFQLIKLLGAFLLIGCLTQCTVIKEGEVGVKRKLGKYSDKPYDVENTPQQVSVVPTNLKLSAIHQNRPKALGSLLKF